ncbi:MAG: sensor domain-containing diguanylate cyclase [Desulfobacterales bacterium]|nr:sensor domain-containing diguanylate cyclase [Desulfobacterales bacterium]
MTDHPMNDSSLLLDHMEAVQELVQLCPDGIIGVDRSGKVTIFNFAAEKMTGRQAAEVIGKMHIADVYGSPELPRNIKKALHAQSHGGPGQLINFEAEILNIGGDTVPIRLSAKLIVRKEKEVGSVGFFSDLSKQKQMENRLRELSITDGLTGLFNHRYFHVYLSREMARAERYQRPLSLICLDLDHFKQCNDEMGHLEGDNVLRLVGEILRGVTRRTDPAFRYGGDEFFVLLPETGLSEAVITAEKIRRTLKARWPYDVQHEGVQMQRVTLSIGVAQADPGEASASLLKRADMAMYDAKRGGGDRVATASRAGTDP